MNDTPHWITAACDADLVARSGAMAIARESFTVEDAVRMYVDHQRLNPDEEKTAQQAAK